MFSTKNSFRQVYEHFKQRPTAPWKKDAAPDASASTTRISSQDHGKTVSGSVGPRSQGLLWFLSPPKHVQMYFCWKLKNLAKSHPETLWLVLQADPLFSRPHKEKMGRGLLLSPDQNDKICQIWSIFAWSSTGFALGVAWCSNECLKKKKTIDF